MCAKRLYESGMRIKVVPLPLLDEHIPVPFQQIFNLGPLARTRKIENGENSQHDYLFVVGSTGCICMLKDMPQGCPPQGGAGKLRKLREGKNVSYPSVAYTESSR